MRPLVRAPYSAFGEMRQQISRAGSAGRGRERLRGSSTAAGVAPVLRGPPSRLCHRRHGRTLASGAAEEIITGATSVLPAARAAPCYWLPCRSCPQLSLWGLLIGLQPVTSQASCSPIGCRLLRRLWRGVRRGLRAVERRVPAARAERSREAAVHECSQPFPAKAAMISFSKLWLLSLAGMSLYVGVA